MSVRDFFETQKRLFGTLAPEEAGDFFQTLLEFRAERARETPVARRRVPIQETGQDRSQSPSGVTQWYALSTVDMVRFEGPSHQSNEVEGYGGERHLQKIRRPFDP